jgi:hypothetical protein
MDADSRAPSAGNEHGFTMETRLGQCLPITVKKRRESLTTIAVKMVKCNKNAAKS